MRIIAGKHRGRVLASFPGEDVRPTADRVKESVFQILTPRLAGARVLDLFAGSGALGAECLSRGAAEVVFNDHSAASLAILRKNLRLLREEALILQSDFRSCLSRAEGQFGLILSDPPYREDFLAEICRLTAARDLLAAGGLIVHEGERQERAPDGWALADVRRYGRTYVSFLARSES